jgi:F-type H+-transporting ATPase subunit epsilon
LEEAEQALAGIKAEDKQGKIQAEQALRTARARLQATTAI